MKKKLIQMGLMNWQVDMILESITLKTVHGIYRLKKDQVYLKSNGSRSYLAV